MELGLRAGLLRMTCSSQLLIELFCYAQYSKSELETSLHGDILPVS